MTLHGLIDLLSNLIVLGVGIALLAVALLVLWAWLTDEHQSEHTIRRNFPVIGRFRYWFEELGVFLRQYFFASDREELPFNRAERASVYRAAKNLKNLVPFGSTQSLSTPGTAIFLPSAFPTNDEDAAPVCELTIGENTPNPYRVKSFYHISGMSFGALSAPAVRALSKGAAKADCWINTGEGGLSPYHLEGGGDVVVQIGTAKYGVRDEHGHLCEAKLRSLAERPNVRMFELKLSQGAKPGKGGILPAAKITPEVAQLRGIPLGQDSISPNRHPEIHDIDSLLNMVAQIRAVTQKPCGIKMVIGDPAFVEALCLGILQRGVANGPDFITVDGGEGGTGAAPQSLIDNVGLPLREALPIVVNTLRRHGLKDDIEVIASGKLITPAAVALALAMGADFCVSARGFMFALGCIQALKCNTDTCPTGITTHDPRLQQGLDVELKAQRVANFVRNMQHEVGVIAHSCGLASPRDLRPEHVRLVMDSGHSEPLKQWLENY